MLLPRPPAPGTEPRFSTGEVISSRVSPKDAESLAASFLQQGVTEADVCALVPHLKSERPARGQGVPSEFSFTTGAYVHGSLVGLRTHASTFPNVMRCLCDLVTRRAPEIEFSSIALFKDLCTPPHRDLNNSSGFSSCLIPCSSFEGGELWIEDEAGSVACPDPAVATTGRLLSLTGPTLFDPHLLRATAPWVGSRVVMAMAAFVIARFELLTASDRSALQSLGFRCPALSTGDKAGLAPPRPLHSNFPVVFEIFSGTARITTALRSFWPHCFGVDSRPSSEARSHTLVADLSSTAGQDLLWHWLRCPYLVGLWIAPPSHQSGPLHPSLRCCRKRCAVAASLARLGPPRTVLSRVADPNGRPSPITTPPSPSSPVLVLVPVALRGICPGGSHRPTLGPLVRSALIRLFLRSAWRVALPRPSRSHRLLSRPLRPSAPALVCSPKHLLMPFWCRNTSKLLSCAAPPFCSTTCLLSPWPD